MKLFLLSLTLTLAVSFGEEAILASDRDGTTISPIIHTISAAGLFTCSSSNPVIKSVCKIGLHKVTEMLAKKSLHIENNGIVFKYENHNHQDVDTGHSCKITLKAKYRQLSAVFKTPKQINLVGDILFKPISQALKLPAQVYGKVDMNQRFGAKVFRKCHRYASDSYTAEGKLDTTVDVILSVALKPELNFLSNGNYELVVTPAASLLFELEDTDLKFNLHGVSILGRVLTFLTTIVNGIFDILNGLVSGRGIVSIFKDVKRKYTVAAGLIVGLNYDILPIPLRKLVDKTLNNYIGHEADKRVKGFGEDMEDKLNEQLKKIIGVGNDGKRRIPVNGMVANFIKNSLGESVGTINHSNLSDIELVVRYEWPVGEAINSNTEFADEKSGTGCGLSGKYVNVSRVVGTNGGFEESVIQIGQAEKDGKWSVSTQIKLHSTYMVQITNRFKLYAYGNNYLRYEPAIVSAFLRTVNTGEEIPGTKVGDMIWPDGNRYANCSKRHVANLNVQRVAFASQYMLTLQTL